MTAMIDARGAAYAAAWPANIARSAGVAQTYVIDALNKVLGANIPHCTAGATLIPEVGALEPEQARAVVAEVRATARRIDEHGRRHCHYCGLPLVGGECTECV